MLPIASFSTGQITGKSLTFSKSPLYSPLGQNMIPHLKNVDYTYLY